MNDNVLIQVNDLKKYYDGGEIKALDGVSLEIDQGEVVVIIGPSGSGKSTLLRSLNLLEVPTSGEILVDGVDVRQMELHTLRDKLGFVPQRGVLFSGTVASNLRYGAPEASEQEIRQAASIAQASDFIEEKEEGYDSPIAQGGTNVSGGQKQRLSIARAIASKPEIYLFDDSFSALDFKPDAALRRALKKETAGVTTVLVAQRVSTIMQADLILVLDEGRVAGQGTHRELMESCEVYRQIAQSQLSQEELKA